MITSWLNKVPLRLFQISTMMCATYMISASFKRKNRWNTQGLPGLQADSKRYPDPSCMGWQTEAEFKKLKGNDNTEDKYVEAGNTWNLENATKRHMSKNKNWQKKTAMQ